MQGSWIYVAYQVLIIRITYAVQLFLNYLFDATLQNINL